MNMIIEVDDMMRLLYTRQDDLAREEFVRWLHRRRSLMLNRNLNGNRGRNLGRALKRGMEKAEGGA